MAADSFPAYVLDQLSGLDGLGCRAMFGGHGLYLGPTFFGILSDGRAYLKTDERTAARYVARGMQPFRPSDKQVLKTYYEVPPDVLEDREAFRAWAIEAAEAAGRGARTRPARRQRSPS